MKRKVDVVNWSSGYLVIDCSIGAIDDDITENQMTT